MLQRTERYVRLIPVAMLYPHSNVLITLERPGTQTWRTWVLSATMIPTVPMLNGFRALMTGERHIGILVEPLTPIAATTKSWAYLQWGNPIDRSYATWLVVEPSVPRHRCGHQRYAQ
jgi:hypothetical protein